MRRIRRILVPVDFGEQSNRVVESVLTLAVKFKASVLLLHVMEPFTYMVTDTIQVRDHYASLKSIAEPLMDGFVKRIAARGVKVEGVLVRGNPYREIVERARKSRCDLIVMGTHGRTGLEHMLLGSVAERVVRLAPCPVLTIRGGSKGKRARAKATNRSVTLIG